MGELASGSLITHVVGRCHLCQPVVGRTRFLADFGGRGGAFLGPRLYRLQNQQLHTKSFCV